MFTIPFDAHKDMNAGQDRIRSFRAFKLETCIGIESRIENETLHSLR